MTWLDAQFGRLYSNGTRKELAAGVNFSDDLEVVETTMPDGTEVLEVRVVGDVPPTPEAGAEDGHGLVAVDGAWAAYPLPYISAMDPRFGAVGDGVADDKAAILAAINAAIAASAATTRSVPVVGSGLVHGVSGNLELPDGAHMRDVALKQLDPDAAGDVRTLTSDDADSIRLVRVTVDRNGDGTNGALSDDAGIYISGGSGHYFEDLEVFGDDIGTGIAIVGASDFRCVRLYARDMNYDLGADPGDDRVQGIWFQNCSKFAIVDPLAHDLGGNFGAGATTRWSRGIVYGGCSDFTVHNPRGWNVDQGHDITGSDGNVRFEITGGLMQDCYTFGFKFANSARDGTITGAVALRCGQAGFIASGPADTISIMTSDLDFVGCKSYDSGSNGAYGTAAGFRITDGGAGAAGSTRGIRFIGCKAHDRQGSPTMDYGFLNDVAANSDGRYNECDPSCVSFGHVTAAFSGMNASRCTARFNAAQAIGNNAWAAVNWDLEDDRGAMHSLVSSTDIVNNRRPGVYRLTAGVSFAANATGQRGIRFYEQGSEVPGSTVLVNAAAVGETSLVTTITLELTTTRNLVLGLFQDSGGNLNAQTTSRFTVEQIG